VTETGKINSKLLGLITFRDIDFFNKDQWSTISVDQVMTPIDELITAKNNLTLKDAYLILQRSKKGSFVRSFDFYQRFPYETLKYSTLLCIFLFIKFNYIVL